MKKFVLLWICALGVCLVGCSDDDTPEQLPDPELTLAPDAPIAFPAKGGNVEIAVTTNMETWSAVSDQEWCKVAASAGKFTVSAVENETLAPMPAATVTVTASTGERSVSRKLQVSQEAGKEKIVDLSEAGTSNCYLVTAAGNYSFDATVRGNGATTEGLDAPTAIAGTSAAVVWQSAPGLISGVTLADGRISFKIAGPGNAVIAVKDGAILWSWHIWYPEAEVAGLNSKTGYEVMNMNLGAMHNTPGDVGSYGLLYQWGRKDPFPAAPTLTGTTATVGAPIYDGDNNEIKITNSSQSSTADNNLAFAIANPTVCLSNYAQFSTSRDWLQADASNDALWGNPKGAERNETNDFLNKGGQILLRPVSRRMARSACRRIPQLHRIGRLSLGDRRFRYRRHQRRRCEIARRLRLRLDFQSERQRIFLLPRSGALRRLLRHADGQHERLVGFLLGQRTLPRRQVPGRGLLGALVPDQGHGRQRDDYHLARRRRCPRRRLLGALHPRINLSDAFTTESGAECRLPIPFAGRATCRERTDARSPRRRGICA